MYEVSDSQLRTAIVRVVGRLLVIAIDIAASIHF